MRDIGPHSVTGADAQRGRVSTTPPAKSAAPLQRGGPDPSMKAEVANLIASVVSFLGEAHPDSGPTSCP